MWALKDRFPLHNIVFKQTACHIPHEVRGRAPLCLRPAKLSPRAPPDSRRRARPANPPVRPATRPTPRLYRPTASSYSRPRATSRTVSDPNMNVEFLGTLTSIMKNKAAFNPKVAAILDKYFAKFHDKPGDQPVPTTPTATAAPSAAGPSNICLIGQLGLVSAQVAQRSHAPSQTRLHRLASSLSSLPEPDRSHSHSLRLVASCVRAAQRYVARS